MHLDPYGYDMMIKLMLSISKLACCMMTKSAANHIELSGVAVRTAVHAGEACKKSVLAIKKLGHLQISSM